MSRLREVIGKAQNTEKHMNLWTSEEKEICRSRYGCEVIIQNGSYSEVSTKDTPSDAYIVKYFFENKIYFDLTRGTRTKIFDMYWDKFGKDLKSIDFGYGTVISKNWGYQAPKNKKRK